MLHLILPSFLLGAALGLSLKRFILPYLGKNMIEASAPATLIASAVFLAALAMTVGDQGFWSASVTLLCGAMLAVILDNGRPNLVTALSAACLFGYLGVRTI